jgi:TnpA family transposase
VPLPIKNFPESDHLLSLDSEELTWVRKKLFGSNQLAFAIMLKYFQIVGHYPINTTMIPESLTTILASQLNTTQEPLGSFDWRGITAKRFRQEIRHYLGYRKAKARDKENLMVWLIEKVLSQAPTLAQCYEKVVQYFRDEKLEPIASQALERHVRSAYARFEKQFFADVTTHLSTQSKNAIDTLLQGENDEPDEKDNSTILLEDIKFKHVKKDITGHKLKQINFEIDKVKRLQQIGLPNTLFNTVSRKLILKYYERIATELPSEINKHAPEPRYAMMASFCHIQSQKLTDSLADVFIQLIHKMKTSAESFVTNEIVSDVKCVNGKFDILYLLSSTAAEKPKGIIQHEIYPHVSQETLRDLAKELQSKGNWYQTKVQFKIRSLYSHASRRILLTLLNTFHFCSNNPECNVLLQAIDYIKQHQEGDAKYYPDQGNVPIKNVISSKWHAMVIETDDTSKNHGSSKEQKQKINRLNYEVAVLEELREKLRCKAIWIEGAYRYRDPDEDLPHDFNSCREYYYQTLNLPIDAAEFITLLKENVSQNLQSLNDNLLTNKKVKIVDKDGGRIKISPSEPQAEPKNIKELQRAINRRWSTINLIDILKETDLRIGFSDHFHTLASRATIHSELLRKRLLLSLYAIGSNAGLKRISAANADSNYSDLRYIKRKFMNAANVRAAIVQIVNEILAIRDPLIWGIATTGCACDSTQVSSWDQNLMTEWHTRYHGRGVMIYWHVDTRSTCIYSQLKTCSSSEVGAMIQGVLKHATTMDLQKGYVDTHGQSTIGFAISHLLHFDLLPRLKNINKQKLYGVDPHDKTTYGNLSPILKETINWKIIKENYDEIVKYIAALKIGTVEPDVLIKRFSKDNYNHPVYKALTELGKAVKTIFLCRYLSSEELRIEIHEALNVVERLNSIMGFIFYGKLGEISTNKQDDQELSVVCLHLLQVCMVYINTLLIQEILADPLWKTKLTPEDMRALSPLIHTHINPYGLFPLDLKQRLLIEEMIKTQVTRVSNAGIPPTVSEAAA